VKTENICYWSASLLQSHRANTVQTFAMLNAFWKICPSITFASAAGPEILNSIDPERKKVSLQGMSIFKINNILREKGITHLIARSGGKELPLSLMGLTIVSEFHDEPHTLLSKIRLSVCSRLKNYSKAVVVSQGLADRIKLFVPSQKIVVLHDGVSVGSIHKHVRSLPQDNVWKFGYAGSFSSGKGVDQVVAAAAKVPQAEFLIIGGTADDFKNSYSDCDDVPGNCIFYGRRDHSQIPQLLSSCDALILPNNFENPLSEVTSPLKLFEYMAAGRPIISSQVGSLKEILREGESCIGFKGGNTDSLTESINFLIKNPEAGVSCAAIASEEIKKYTWEKRAEAMLSLFDV
jgi:glycosyltransferase involved in cell wall biosynthesis